MKLVSIALATALLTISGAAAAQSASDAQCLILSNAFAKNTKDPQQQKAAEASMYFYLGRVSGGTASPAQLKSLLDSQAKLITDATAGGTMNNCVKTLESKIKMVQSFAPAQQPQQPKGR
jgi:hypothetical protein